MRGSKVPSPFSVIRMRRCRVQSFSPSPRLKPTDWRIFGSSSSRMMMARTNGWGLIRPIADGKSSRNCCAPAIFVVFSLRSEEHTSELQSLMRISYAVFCLKKKKQKTKTTIDARQYAHDIIEPYLTDY